MAARHHRGPAHVERWLHNYSNEQAAREAGMQAMAAVDRVQSPATNLGHGPAIETRVDISGGQTATVIETANNVIVSVIAV
jgi:hypothetical protein